MPWALRKRELRLKSNGPGLSATDPRARGRIASALARAIALTVVLTSLTACSSFGDFFASKDDDVYVEEPADKLYNEGLYLLNDKRCHQRTIVAAKAYPQFHQQFLRHANHNHQHVQTNSPLLQNLH